MVYALFVGFFFYCEIKFQNPYDLVQAAAKTSSVEMLLGAAALVSAWLITAANIPRQIVQMMGPFMDIKMLLVMIVGTALDFAPTVLILTPVLMPLVREAGIDPVYFACCSSTTTPSGC